jgi:phage terminase large subunit
VAHRRCGKTVACINDTIRRAVTMAQPHGRFAYVAPFLTQAKEVAWDYLKRYAQPIIRDKNESELWVELVNGSRIRVHGADNPDRLRGAYLDGVILDEYADMRPSVWGEVIRPMLADRLGWATFIGTPKGRNEFHQIWELATQSEQSRWFSAMLKASETGILAKHELDDARGDMTPEQYEQEFECSFDAAIWGAYFGKEIAEAERDGRITDVGWDASLPVHTAWDLGIGDSTAIWLWQASGGDIRVIDCLEDHNRKLTHYVGELKARGQAAGERAGPSAPEVERRGYVFGIDWVPHDARVRELGTGRTRIETLIEAGRLPKLVPDHKKMDGINAARMVLPRVWFDRDRCREGIEALRQYRNEYDEKTKAFKNEPKHDWTSHYADAFRYMCMAWRAIAKPQEPKPLPPMRGVENITVDELLAIARPARIRV